MSTTYSLNPKVSTVPKGGFLGHIVSENDVKVDAKKTDCIRK